MNDRSNEEKPIRPKIAVSACLLGQKVRYNGGDKAHRWIIEVLSQAVDFLPLCPEMEMGLGAPRQTMRLVSSSGNESPRIVTHQTEIDLTPKAVETAERILSRLTQGGVDALILKKNSPSCGVAKVKIYGPTGIPHSQGQGIFAQLAQRAFPGAPMIEEGRLSDPAQREHFLTRVFTLCRFNQIPFEADSRSLSLLQRFHQEHKFLLLSHDPAGYAALGQIAANTPSLQWKELREKYRLRLEQALALAPTEGKRLNALQHLFGFFKQNLSAREKEHVGALLQEYREGLKPFAAVLVLIEHLSRRFEQDYVLRQMILRPFPQGIALFR